MTNSMESIRLYTIMTFNYDGSSNPSLFSFFVEYCVEDVDDPKY